ncbi:MAG: hypothetical protein QM796_16495 [Chthoniobacteraceae bacterium]
MIGWPFSRAAAVGYCLAASSLAESRDWPRGLPTGAATLAAFLLPASIALWVLGDARRRGRSLPYDYGSLVFFAWPVLVPVYLFSTRGRRGWATIGIFLLLYLGTGLAVSVVLLPKSIH